MTIARKHRTWLCPQCQPWIPPRTHEQILADAARAMDGETDKR